MRPRTVRASGRTKTQLTQLEIQREVERAKREGRWGDVEELEILLAAIGGVPAPAPEPAETYVLQEGDDPFGVAERELGSIEYVPRLLQNNPNLGRWRPGKEIELPVIEEEEPGPGELVDLFETKGPPGPSWTADDWARLDAVRAEIEAGQALQDVDEDEEDDSELATVEGQEDVGEEADQAETTNGELPPGIEDIELPEEQAEAVAQYLAQMILSGELGDLFVVEEGQAMEETPSGF